VGNNGNVIMSVEIGVGIDDRTFVGTIDGLLDGLFD
jgi:hypothetical protein